MIRGVAAVKQALEQATRPVAIVTHGNLMALILKYFDAKIGFAEWNKLQNPDIYCIELSQQGTHQSHFAEQFSIKNF
jgi:2,3-bisphosphoglycerate-dependent phosphoglycerate mutase